MKNNQTSNDNSIDKNKENSPRSSNGKEQGKQVSFGLV